MAIGPVQFIAVEFGPDANFEGKVIEELARLEQAETIRLLDLLFVHKDAESGDLVALDVQGEDLGGIIGALLGFEFEDDGETPSQGAGETDHAFGLSSEQIESIGANLPRGRSAATMLIEHVWARDLKKAIRDAGGVPVAEGFLTPEAIATVGAELIAISEAVDQLEVEQPAASN
jgi:hypothetical protein